MNEYEIGERCYYPPPMMLTGFGAWVVTSKAEIQNQHGVSYSDMGNGKALVTNHKLDPSQCRIKFYDAFLDERVASRTVMLGAICGDVAGSVYEHHNIKEILPSDRLIHHHAHITDDSVMTLAVAVGLEKGLKRLNKAKDFGPEDEPVLLEELTKSLHFYGNCYPNAGYGRAFHQWLASPNPQPYGSWGNGSAMRASYPGFFAQSLSDAEFLAEASAKVTHDHPEGIKGAKVVAGCIWTLMNEVAHGADVAKAKRAVLAYASQFYDLNFTLDEIRPGYRFYVSCQESVPQAIRAFLEGTDFSQTLALAISIGGDSDTIAAIAGSMAEIVYPIPEGVRNRVLRRLDPAFRSALAGAIDYAIDTRNHLSNEGRRSC